jgi:hypothetical protein
MASTQVRKQVAALTTGLALAVLLAGPGVTWGLDVPVVGGSGDTTSQLAATVQGVVTTAEQTTASTVTSVQTAAPATVVQETAANPVQSTAGTVAAAPTRIAPRRTAPAQKKAPAAATRKATLTHVSETTGLARQAPRSAAGALREVARKPTLSARPHIATRAKPLPATSPAARSTAAEPASQCPAFPLLALLPGGVDLGALLTIVCDAGDLLAPPRIGDGRAAGPGISIGGILGAAAAGEGAAYARAAALHRQQPATAGDRRATPGGGHGGSPVAGAAGNSPAGTSAFAYANRAVPHVGTAGSGQATAKAAGHSHRGFFSTPVDGTGALSLVLLLDSVLLAAVVLWRLARRWLVPRLA